MSKPLAHQGMLCGPWRDV